MVLINSVKKSFNCVIENPSITLFLVLFLIVLSVLTKCIAGTTTKITFILLFLCFFALVFAYFSGWFKVIKESSDREKIKEKNFYMIFLEGVGENIISVSTGIVLYGIALIVVVFLSQLIALKVFGDINFFVEGLNNIQNTNGNFIEYFNNLNENQQYTVYGWNICIMLAVVLFNFFSTFYFPSVLDNEGNQFLKPFIAILGNLKFLFKNFFAAIGLNIFIYILNMIIAFFSARFAQNVILSTLFLLVHIYFISYVVMLIFNYYEQKNNCSDGCNSLGENETVDTVSEEN